MSIISALVLIAGLVAPVSAGAPDGYVPETINGLPVIFVQTPANTSTLTEGSRIITILDNRSSSVEESRELFRSTIEATKSILGTGDSVEVFGGTGTSKEQYIRNHEENDAAWRAHPPVKNAPPTTTSAMGKTPLPGPLSGTVASYAVLEDTDPDIRTVLGIKAHMAGITIGTSQDTWSYFMVNGWTNTGFFVQSGQSYGIDGTRTHISYDSINGIHAFNGLSYTTNHNYTYDIISWGNGAWWMGVTDDGSGNYDYVIRYNGSGSQLVKSANTSVFFENYNTNSNWYNGFPVYVSASHARDMNSSSQWVNWSQEFVLIFRNGTTYSNNGKISGSLTGDQSALWDLTLLMLGQ
jgi:hypothetical protein